MKREFGNNPVWGNGDKPVEESKTADIIYKEPNFVERRSNHIYFYGTVGRAEILQLNKELKELENELLHSAKIQDREPANIFLHINSYGGGIFDGLAAMDAVLACKVPITTIIDGCCASAATFISVVGDERWIPKHSFMLIHQLSAMTWGKYRELQDDNINFNKLMGTIKKIYTEHTKIPDKKISEILDHDLWFDAKTCLKYGLVDKII